MSLTDTTNSISDLTPNQARALNALMATTSIENAAKQRGLGVATIKRYLAQDEFKKAYRQQRTILLSETVSGLTQLLGAKAIAVIAGALDNEDDPNAQLRGGQAHPRLPRETGRTGAQGHR
jgi:hypothetical protein